MSVILNEMLRIFRKMYHTGQISSQDGIFRTYFKVAGKLVGRSAFAWSGLVVLISIVFIISGNFGKHMKKVLK